MAIGCGSSQIRQHKRPTAVRASEVTVESSRPHHYHHPTTTIPSPLPNLPHRRPPTGHSRCSVSFGTIGFRLCLCGGLDWESHTILLVPLCATYLWLWFLASLFNMKELGFCFTLRPFLPDAKISAHANSFFFQRAYKSHRNPFAEKPVSFSWIGRAEDSIAHIG